MLPATAERAGVLGLTVLMLDPLRDVDTAEDLRREWTLVAPLLDPALRERLAKRLVLDEGASGTPAAADSRARNRRQRTQPSIGRTQTPSSPAPRSSPPRRR